MTVSVPADLYYSDSGDGVTSQFSYPVRVLEAGELVVKLSEDGIETTQVLSTDYTLSGIGDEGGVTITFMQVPTADQTVIRYRDTAAKQIVDLEDRAKNSAEAVEKQLDRLTMVDQDQGRRLGDLEEVAGDLDQAVSAAAASATAAATSETNAAASATAADADADRAEAAAASIDYLAVADRTALKAVDTTTHTAALLKEAGREGQFIWDASDLSTEVSADTQEGIYVAPTSDATGASGAWVRRYDGPADIKWWGPIGDGSTDDRAAFQGAYDTLPDQTYLYISDSATSYTLSTIITLDGDKRLYYITSPNARWTSEADLRKAVGNELTNNVGELWRSHEHFTDYTPTSGGLKHISALRPVTNSVAGYQWDAYRIHVENRDPSSGPSWDGEGETNINRGVIGLGIFANIHSTNLYGQIWGLNAYAYIEPGGEGTLRGVESNLDNTASLVKEVDTNNNKVGIFSTTKSGACTAAFYAGKGIGDGWYKGYIVKQEGLVDDAASRAFEYTGLFEVMRDGTVLVGKGASATFAKGAQLSPNGGAILTATGQAATLDFARTESQTGTAGIGTISARGLDAGGNSTVYAQVDFTCTDGTDATEDGKIGFTTVRNGALAERMYVRSGLIMAGATGDDKGAGTINAVAVYDDNVLLTDLVLDFAAKGSFDAEKYATHPLASEMQEWWLDPRAYADFWREHRHLPAVPSWDSEDARPSTGEMLTRHTAELELHAIHTARLLDMIEALENRVKALESR